MNQASKKLLAAALRAAVAVLVEGLLAQPATKGCKAKRKLPTGIYSHRSKYNPYRAYVWNGEAQIYLGAFPSITAAKRAQREYRAGKQPSTGTRVANHRKPLALVA